MESECTVKQKILSITKDDFRWDYYSGSGKGGQHRNRHKNSVRCFHDPSGAMGKSEDERSKDRNMKLAWKRCINTDKFQQWLKIETARAMGKLDGIDKKVDKEMEKVKVQVKDQKGNWVDE